MATIKSVSAIWNNQTLTAGGGPTTSSAVNLADGYGATVNIKLANGATGPTAAAEVQIEVSEDNSEWYEFGPPIVGNTDNDGVVSRGGVAIPMATKYARLVATHPTGQNVTVDADLSEVAKL